MAAGSIPAVILFRPKKSGSEPLHIQLSLPAC